MHYRGNHLLNLEENNSMVYHIALFPKFIFNLGFFRNSSYWRTEISIFTDFSFHSNCEKSFPVVLLFSILYYIRPWFRILYSDTIQFIYDSIQKVTSHYSYCLSRIPRGKQILLQNIDFFMSYHINFQLLHEINIM